MDARKRKKSEVSSGKERYQDEGWGSPAEWDDLPTWKPTPEEQKAWEDELANMPTLEDLWEDLKKGKK